MAQQVKADHNSRASAGSSTDGAKPMFGERNTRKPIKTIIGIVVLLALSFILYQLGEKTGRHRTSPPDAQRNVMPLR